MPKTPAVSIVIPARDALRHLPATLDSVYRQTFRDFEILLIDDASSDGTREWLSARPRPNLRRVRLRVRHGAAGARNAGLRRARAPLIAFLDADDVWKPRYLESMVRALSEGTEAAAVSDVDLIDEAGRTIARSRFKSRACGVDEDFLRISGLLRPPPPSAVVLRREATVEIGFMDETLRLGEDMDYWLRLCGRFGKEAFCFVDQALLSYRVHACQQTAVCRADPGRLSPARPFGDYLKGSPREREYLLDRVLYLRKHPGRGDSATRASRSSPAPAVFRRVRRRP